MAHVRPLPAVPTPCSSMAASARRLRRSRAMHGSLIGFAGLVAFTLAGCSPSASAGSTRQTPTAQGASSPSSPVTSIDPCTLMTRQEASTILGVSVGDGQSFAGQCFFRSDASAGTSVTLQLEQKSDSGAATASFHAERVRLSSRGANIIELDLSGGAFIGHLGDVSAIYILDGSNFYYIICGPNCTDEALRTGATLVAGRLR
jgi:hypothetical protein